MNSMVIQFLSDQMQITSVGFYVFVAFSLLIYWSIRGRNQWVVLLVDSLFFYFCVGSMGTLVWLLLSAVLVYLATMYFVRNPDKEKQKKLFLTIVIIINVGLLAVFKYLNLFGSTFNDIVSLTGHIGPYKTVNLVAPLAISYYTLQLISYLLDCYWGVATPYKNPLKLILYTCYFPLMTSGPICRYSDIGEEMFAEHHFDYDRVTRGMRRTAWGLFKKMVISGRLALIVDAVYNDPNTYSGLYIWYATLIFSLQLYTDFSGCMDIISGVSECFGIELPDNFRSPFFASTIQELWQRWHITLGTWLRDYIMNPLLMSHGFQRMGKYFKKKIGRKRGKKIPVYLAMLVVWLCMGLWHGSSWKYVIGEGIWFWIIMVISEMLSPLFEKMKSALKVNDQSLGWKVFQCIRTYFLFSFGMLFFRAPSLKDSFSMIRLSNVKNFNFFNEDALRTLGGMNNMHWFVLIISLAILFFVDKKSYETDSFYFENIKSENLIGRWIVYLFLISLIILSSSLSLQEFLYAQF